MRKSKNNNSVKECGLKIKECKGMQVGDKVLEKCIRCPVYKKGKS